MGTDVRSEFISPDGTVTNVEYWNDDGLHAPAEIRIDSGIAECRPSIEFQREGQQPYVYVYLKDIEEQQPYVYLEDILSLF
jgi:hypothetical protein